MKKTGYVPILLLALPLFAHGEECRMNPWDPQVRARLAPEARSVELTRGEERCIIALDCTVRAQPTAFGYELATLVKGKIPPTASLMRGITFEFADGTRQACRATGTHALD